jgi:hypothetical protein
VHLRISLAVVEQRLREMVRDAEAVREVALSGDGDVLRAEVVVRWRGLKTRAIVEIGEVRLRYRLLGFRVRKVRVLGGLPIPRFGVEAILRSVVAGPRTVVPGNGIVIVDLGPWIPPEVVATVVSVQVTRGFVHVWLGSGCLWRLPAGEARALPAPSESGHDKPLRPD